MSTSRYSQPLPEYTRDASGPVVRAGFVGDGPNKQPGFVFYNRESKRVEEHAVTRENKTNQQPRGFFLSLARMMFGGRR